MGSRDDDANGGSMWLWRLETVGVRICFIFWM